MASLKSVPTKRRNVIDTLKKEIVSGKLPPGSRLSTVREMSAYFAISPSGVHGALKELIESGFVECRGAEGFYVAGTETAQAETGTLQKNRRDAKIFFSCVHHSDLVWKRGYDDYEAVREEQLEHLLQMAAEHEEFCFGIEQSEILDVYLKKHPERLSEIQALVRAKKLELFGGLSIPDQNMSSGEALLRNLIAGREYYERIFGEKVLVANFNDAFGLGMQTPQMLNLAGYRYLVATRLPNAPENCRRLFMWNGAAKSSVCVAFPYQISHAGHQGYVPMTRTPVRELECSVEALKYSCTGKRFPAMYMLEVGLFLPELFPLLENARKTGGTAIEFSPTLAFFQEQSAEELPEFNGDFNPIMTGCYVTRIGVKQEIRRLEHALFQAEFLNALNRADGDFSETWHQLFLVQFHDAICGCHSDVAATQIRQKLDLIAAAVRGGDGDSLTFCNFNNIAGRQLACSRRALRGVPMQQDGGDFWFEADFPACGTLSLEAGEPDAAMMPESVPPVFETDFFRIDFSSPHPKIWNKEGEKQIFDNNHVFGEIMFRNDCGTMWDELYNSNRYGIDFEREEVTSCIAGALFYKVTVEGRVLPYRLNRSEPLNYWTGFESLSWKKEFIFPRHQADFKMRLTLDWKGFNTKVEVRFPVDIPACGGIFTTEVPFGSIVRKPYFEVAERNVASLQELASPADYNHAHGDWPVLNWSNISDGGNSLSIANTGTPGQHFNDGSVYVSLIRSGKNLKDGNLLPDEGAMDCGRHVYEFAFQPHSARMMETAPDLAMRLNRPIRPVKAACGDGGQLQWEKHNVVLSSVSASSQGILVRLFETLGRKTCFEPEGAWCRNGFMVCGADGSAPGKRLREYEFKPLEIVTLLFPWQ